MDSNPFEGLPPETMRELQEAYRKGLPDKLKQIRMKLDALQKEKSKELLTDLRFLVHKMAGSAGSFGYSAVSNICKTWEAQIVAVLTSGELDHSQLYRDSERYFAEIQEKFSHV